MTLRAPPKAANDNSRPFGDPRPYLTPLGEKDVASLLKSGSDITLVLSKDGRIEDLAYRDPRFAALKAPDWTGRLWQEVVTVESVEKITSMLADIGEESAILPRQVNHPDANGPDMPVRYHLVSLRGGETLFAFGENLTEVASAQSRLVQAQMDLEADYRKLRATEARYRTVFQMSNRAVLVIDGANRTILDANRAAGTLFGKDVAKLIGDAAPNLIDRTARKEGVAVMTEAYYQGSAKSFRASLAAGEAGCLVTVEPFRENGQNNMLMSFDPLSTAPKENATNPDGLHLLNNHPEGAVLLDAQGHMIAVNEQFLDLVQSLNRDRIIGRPLSNWLGASSVDTQVLLSKLRKEGRVASFATVAQDETGGTADVMVSASSMMLQGETHFLLIIAKDTRRPSSLPPGSYGADTKPGGISELVGRVPMKELIRDSVDVIEKMCIEAALNQTGNNRASAADLLGLSRQSLYIKLKRYGLEDFGDE